MKEENPIDLMKELAEESVEALTELIQEEVSPLLKYRAELEKKMGDKEIREMRQMEADVGGIEEKVAQRILTEKTYRWMKPKQEV